MMQGRRARTDGHRGRRPLALQAHPRDICRQKMLMALGHFLSENIPAGGSCPQHPTRPMVRGAQNPFFKDFSGQRVRP